MGQFKILAISGSLRSGSSNHNILKYLGTLLPEDVDYSIYDELTLIPPFDPGLDNDTPTLPVTRLRELLAAANGVIICTPEYAFGVPGQLKNMLDWLVSNSSLVDKPVSLITASSSGQYAHPSLLIPFIRAKMDSAGNITDEDTLKELNAVMQAFLSSF